MIMQIELSIAHIINRLIKHVLGNLISKNVHLNFFKALISGMSYNIFYLEQNKNYF